MAEHKPVPGGEKELEFLVVIATVALLFQQ